MTEKGYMYVPKKGRPALLELPNLLGVDSVAEAISLIAGEIVDDAREMGIVRLTKRNIGIKTTAGVDLA